MGDHRQLTLADSDGPVDGMGAEFSPCRRWRYALTRQWSEEQQQRWLAFIALNPSTADERRNDPTVIRMTGFAKAWGFNGLVVLNIFAWRSTDPQALYEVADPVGPENDAALRRWTQRAGRIVCAWGCHGALHNRGEVVRRLLVDRALEALAINQDGSPRHPLYVSQDTRPIPFGFD